MYIFAPARNLNCHLSCIGFNLAPKYHALHISGSVLWVPVKLTRVVLLDWTTIEVQYGYGYLTSLILVYLRIYHLASIKPLRMKLLMSERVLKYRTPTSKIA